MTKYFDPRTFFLLFFITLAVDYLRDDEFVLTDIGHTIIAAVIGTLIYTNFIKKYLNPS